MDSDKPKGERQHLNDCFCFLSDFRYSVHQMINAVIVSCHTGHMTLSPVTASLSLALSLFVTESLLALFEYEWGWNDPPSVSYQDHSSGAGKKPSSVLQQRVPYPVGSQSSATGRQPGELKWH